MMFVKKRIPKKELESYLRRPIISSGQLFQALQTINIISVQCIVSVIQVLVQVKKIFCETRFWFI